MADHGAAGGGAIVLCGGAAGNYFDAAGRFVDGSWAVVSTAIGHRSLVRAVVYQRAVWIRCGKRCAASGWLVVTGTAAADDEKITRSEWRRGANRARTAAICDGREVRTDGCEHCNGSCGRAEGSLAALFFPRGQHGGGSRALSGSDVRIRRGTIELPGAAGGNSHRQASPGARRDENRAAQRYSFERVYAARAGAPRGGDGQRAGRRLGGGDRRFYYQRERSAGRLHRRDSRAARTAGRLGLQRESRNLRPRGRCRTTAFCSGGDETFAA